MIDRNLILWHSDGSGADQSKEEDWVRSVERSTHNQVFQIVSVEIPAMEGMSKPEPKSTVLIYFDDGVDSNGVQHTTIVPAH